MYHIIQTGFNSVKLFAFSEILALHLPEPVDHALQNQKKTSLAHFFFWKTLIYFEGVESAQIRQPLYGGIATYFLNTVQNNTLA